MVISKNILLPKVSEGVQLFQGGGHFFQEGVQMLVSIETHKNL